MARHVRNGDDVIITSGEFRGKRGKIMQVLTKSDRVVVHGSGIKQIVKNMKPTRLNPQGGKVELDRSFHISNVSPAVDGKPSRVRFPVGKDGSKKRVAARDGSVLCEVRGPRDGGKK